MSRNGDWHHWATGPQRPLRGRHTDIATSREAHGAISAAIRKHGPVRFTGPSGTGKSFALRHHAGAFDAVYCECNGYRKNIRGLFIMLCEAYGLTTPSSQTGDLAREINLHFGYRAAADKPLLVDEWQTLEPPAQRELLRLSDKHEVAMVLCGNAETLFTGRKDRVALEQIHTRSQVQFCSYPLSAEDCTSICIDRNIEGADSRNLVVRLAGRVSFRELDDFLEEAHVLTGGAGSIRLHHIENAVMSIAGTPKRAASLMKPGEAS